MLGAALAPASVLGPAAIAAALVQVLVLALSMAWSPQAGAELVAMQVDAPRYDLREALAPTILAAAAWFGMTALMLAAPSAMMSCGIPAAGIAGLLAWHVVAMYAPGFGIAALARLIGVPGTAVLGLALVIGARLVLGFAGEATVFAGGLVLLAIGWCLATAASTLWLQAGNPPRRVLALHDACLLAAALGGAWAAAGFAL